MDGTGLVTLIQTDLNWVRLYHQLLPEVSKVINCRILKFISDTCNMQPFDYLIANESIHIWKTFIC